MAWWKQKLKAVLRIMRPVVIKGEVTARAEHLCAWPCSKVELPLLHLVLIHAVAVVLILMEKAGMGCIFSLSPSRIHIAVFWVCCHSCSANFSSWNLHAWSRICSCLDLGVLNRKQSCLRSTSFQNRLEGKMIKTWIMRVWEMKAIVCTKSPGGHSTLCCFAWLALCHSQDTSISSASRPAF